MHLLVALIVGLLLLFLAVALMYWFGLFFAGPMILAGAIWSAFGIRLGRPAAMLAGACGAAIFYVNYHRQDSSVAGAGLGTRSLVLWFVGPAVASLPLYLIGHVKRSREQRERLRLAAELQAKAAAARARRHADVAAGTPLTRAERALATRSRGVERTLQALEWVGTEGKRRAEVVAESAVLSAAERTSQGVKRLSKWWNTPPPKA